MNNILNNLLGKCKSDKKSIAVLIDPDKVFMPDLELMVHKISNSDTTHILVGGSIVEQFKTDLVVKRLKELTDLPIILFPGDTNQISPKADALLFLCLISGRNADYLIEKHVKSARHLKETGMEVIPTSYILIGDNNSAVEMVTNTKPIPRTSLKLIVDTAIAGEMLGHKLIYLEAGSGAENSIPSEIIAEVKKMVSIPLIVGGGIKSMEQLEMTLTAGADMVVVGTAFENDFEFFNKTQIKNQQIEESVIEKF